MALRELLRSPFRESSTSALNGTTWQCSIDGRPFRMDTAHSAFASAMQSIAATAAQSDTSAKPGEQSLNREGLWRESSSSWHKGAGQRYRDKEDSDPDRFWASQGVNVWVHDELSLLSDTEQLRGISSTSSTSVVAGPYLYVSDGGTLNRFDGTTWSTISMGSSSGTILSMATNGYTVWITTTTNKYTVNETQTAASTWLSDSNIYDHVAYARGRVLLSRLQNVYEVRGNAAVSLNPNEGSTTQRWTAFGEGTSAIFAAATTGKRSQIHHIVPPESDPSAFLGVPIPAAPPLPTGEVVTAMYGYLGQLVVGTNKGVRVAEEDGNGNLNIGPLIELPSSVLAIDGEGAFVWFAWSNFDTAHTGLGRLDLSQLTDTGVFAYASDLMANDVGDITSIASFRDRRFFTLAGKGVYGEADSFVASGYLDLGLTRYGISDPKSAQSIELRHRKLAGSVDVALSADQSEFVYLGGSDLEGTVTPTIPIDARDISGSSFELRLTLKAGSSGSPVVQHIELRSAITPYNGETFLVPVVLTDNDRDYPGRHPRDDFDALVALKRYRRSVPYVELSKVWPRVIVQDYQFERGSLTQDGTWWNGTMIIKFMAPSA